MKDDSPPLSLATRRPRRRRRDFIWGAALCVVALAAGALISTMVYSVVEAFGQGYNRDAVRTVLGMPGLVCFGVFLFLLLRQRWRHAIGFALAFALITAGVWYWIPARLGSLAAGF